MKKFYLYLNKICVATLEAKDAAHAIERATQLGMAFGINYDSMTTVYQAEPRTAGEVLDDGIDLARRAAKDAVPTVRTKLGKFFSGLGNRLTPTNLPPMVG